MDSSKFSEGLKKLLLAGLGAVATTAEKSQEIIDELSKKGEITLEQNKELKENIRGVFEKKGSEAEELAQKIAKLSKEELAVLKTRVDDLKKMAEEKIHPQDEEENPEEGAEPEAEAEEPAAEEPAAEEPAAEEPAAEEPAAEEPAAEEPAAAEEPEAEKPAE